MYTCPSCKTLLVLFSMFVVSACSTVSQQPEWIDQPSIEYSAEKYLSAVGEADNRETAASRARANLAHIFQVAIKDTQQDFSQALITNSNGAQTTDNQSRVARFVNAEAQQVLEGTEVISYWESPEGSVFSLAVLDKTAASRRFTTDVRNTDRKTNELIDYASNQATNPVVALRALEAARLSQLDRDNDNRNLTITAGKGINSRYSSAEITALIRNALSTLQFSVVADDPLIQSELQNAVASLGIQLLAQSSYKLSSKIDTEPLQKKQGWWWIRGALELELTNNDETLVKQRWPIKQSSQDQGMVQQRLRDMVNKKLPAYLYQMLTAPIES